MKIKTKDIHNSIMKIGAAMLALAVAAGASTPAITSFTQAQPVTKTKKKAKAKKKTKAKKTKSKKKKSYKAKAGTISLSPITLTKGKSKTVSVKTKSKVRWTSSNAKVATVKSISRSKVKVTAKKKGSTKVSGKAGKAKWSFTVKVKGKKPIVKPTGKNTKNKANKTNTAKKKTNTSQESNENNNEAVVAKAKSLLKSKAEAILNESGASQGASDIQKFARLCRWWNNNVTYDFNENSDNYYIGSWLNPYGDKNKLSESMDTEYLSAIRIDESRKGVCGNQAEAIVYFCNLLGIKAKTADYDDNWHMSNHIYFDDGWYGFDATELNRYNNQYGQQNTYVAISDLMNSNEYKNSNSYGKQDEEIRQRLLTKGKSTADLDARIDRRNHLLVYHLAWTYTTNDYDEDYLTPTSSPSHPGNKDSSKISSELNGKKYINTCLNDYL